MKEEDLIRHYDTGSNPFKTPDGYFEGFTSRLMERMEREGLTGTVQTTEQQETQAKVVKMNPFRRAVRYAAAAVVAGLCIGTGTYLYSRHSPAEQMMAGDAMELLLSEETLEQAFDYEVDYEMVDNSQIAYYLTEAY